MTPPANIRHWPRKAQRRWIALAKRIPQTTWKFVRITIDGVEFAAARDITWRTI